MRREFAAAILLTAIFVPVDGWGQIPVCDTAIGMFRQRQWSEAAAGFKDCEQRNPGQTDALLYLGKSLINLEEFPGAESALQSYAKSHPQSDDAAYLLAYVSFRQDKPKESLQLFTDAARLKPPTANDLMIVALDYVLLQDYDDAARYLESSLKMDPTEVEARYHLGRVRYQQNQFDLAIAAFEEVLKRDPGNIKALDNLGLSLEARNRTDQAIAAYRKAIALDQAAPAHSEQPYLNLGSLLEKSNRIDDAVPLLTRAAAIAPGEFEVHYALAKAYFDAGHFESALPESEQAVKLKPSDSSGHYLLGRIYQRLGRKPLADEQFRLTSTLIRDKDSHSQRGMASGRDTR
ncbi:MAG TPA: tetratricopeptide repeat protein [Verrucomicrobiae bacterium]|nr:tetratricopeptide repeat protein [Verrucomicrobiae bacterium]